MSLQPLRDWAEAFLTAAEEERYQIDHMQRRSPQLGRLYREAAELFGVSRITEVQRVLAGARGAEEREIRALLDFVARGRALHAAADQLDERLAWEIFGEVPLGDSRIPHRQIPPALALAADPERRHAIEEAHLATLAEHQYVAEDFLGRHREGIAELGYGSHVQSYQILGSIDLLALAREGERFLAATDDVYRDLLSWHLPRVAGVEPADARAADAFRLAAATEYSGYFAAGIQKRALFESFGAMGFDPLADGRLQVEWEADLRGELGAAHRAPEVPGLVRLGVTTRTGRPALASLLCAYGSALHEAYTDPQLSLERRRLGDESVLHASGRLFESLLRLPAFLIRLYEIPKASLPNYQRLSALLALLETRSEIARLQFDLAWYGEGAGPADYAELMTAATGLRHDERAALWAVDPEFTTARRLRGVQLGAVHARAMRSRFDEDWFRNPRAGGYLVDLFANGRRYSAGELCVQINSAPLGFDALQAEIAGLL